MAYPDLTTTELADMYLRHLAGDLPEAAYDVCNPVFAWEELIITKPEEAWPVFVALLRHSLDDDALEQVSMRLELLLAYHWEAFHLRVEELVHSHSELPRFLTEAALTKEHYIAVELSDNEIVTDYLENYRHFENQRRLEELIEGGDQRALLLVLEIIHRGQLHNFDSFDLLSPLEDLLRRQGENVIDEIEKQAANSVMLRRCLWRIKRQQDGKPPAYRIKEHIWQRALIAAGTTNDYNSELPSEITINQLSDEDEELLSSWFNYEKTSWASSAIWDLLRDDPERLWRIILAMVANASDERTLSFIGAGPLEDIIGGYGEQFIDRIVQEAIANPRFRASLSGVWKSQTSEPVWQRVIAVLEQTETVIPTDNS